MQKGKIYFIGKLFFAVVASHCESDGLDTAPQSKNSYLKILRFEAE
jgi:hypothetical protein